MVDKDLKLETKCYDANEYGYLYGLNKKIPDNEFEKVKMYMKNFRRKDFVDGTIKVTGRPEGYRCLKKDITKVEEILGIENTLEKRKNKIKNAFSNPVSKRNLKDKSYEWLNTLFKKGGTRPKQNLSRLAIHSTKIYDPDDNYKNRAKDGDGVLFIYTPHGMWYIINNNGKYSNLSLNNVETKYGGAVGYRLIYDDTLDTLIRIFSEENEYNGRQGRHRPDLAQRRPDAAVLPGAGGGADQRHLVRHPHRHIAGPRPQGRHLRPRPVVLHPRNTRLRGLS